MGKIAFVFSGQGAQYTGMGKELCEASPAAREVFRMADRIRPGTSRQCFGGTKAELSETLNTQPCVVAVELACAAALGEAGVSAAGAAGFSVGEIAGLAYAGLLSAEDAFSLVCARAKRMEWCSTLRKGGMAAVLGLPETEAERLCGEAGAYPVNYNCPGQLVAAGEEQAISALRKSAAASGGRAVRLAVSGAFHSPLMREASDGLAEDLGRTVFRRPKLPLYSNVTAQPYGEHAAELVARQVKSPVLWQKTVKTMIADGFDTFVEAGPGTTLCGLIRRISGDVRTFGVDDLQGLRACAEQLREENHAE